MTDLLLFRRVSRGTSEMMAEDYRLNLKREVCLCYFFVFSGWSDECSSLMSCSAECYLVYFLLLCVAVVV